MIVDPTPIYLLPDWSLGKSFVTQASSLELPTQYLSKKQYGPNHPPASMAPHSLNGKSKLLRGSQGPSIPGHKPCRCISQLLPSTGQEPPSPSTGPSLHGLSSIRKTLGPPRRSPGQSHSSCSAGSNGASPRRSFPTFLNDGFFPQNIVHILILAPTR